MNSTPPVAGMAWSWASAEGRCLAVGLGLAGLGLLALGVGGLGWPGVTMDVAVMSGLNLVVGRAAGMAWGLARGLPTGWVVACNVVVETVQVLVVYPLFVLSCRQWLAPRWLAEPLEAMRERAERSRRAVRRFGIVGLFVFVFLPFWMTGPVVGSMVGYLLGLQTRTTLAVVLAGTYAAIGVYALFLEEIDAWAATYGRYAVVIVLVAMALAAAGVHRWRSRARR